MRPHEPRLPLVQRPGLLEDAVGDPDLADVVEEEAVLGARVVDQVRADLAGQLERVALDALGVGPRARVLRLERARQRGDGLLVGVLQQRPLTPLDLKQVAEVARVEEELLLVSLPLGRERRRHRLEAAGQALDDVEELEWAEGLPHVGVRGRRLAGEREVADRAREEDDGDALRHGVGLHAPAELEPAHPGHAHVEDDRVRAPQLDDVERSLRARGFLHLDVHDLERRAEQSTESVIVVNDQQAHWRLQVFAAETIIGFPVSH